ncbi:MAG TPA: hypothetical protein VKU60_18145, partial [Chloroflexota bacterium]|nr:hypothetical protein [Chloroflexota bacterium]
MWRQLCLAALLALAVSTADWPTAPQPAAEAAPSSAPPAAAGVLAYVKTGDVWSMNADGSGQTQLTHELNGKFASSPVFSPDGTKIAYASHNPWSADSWGSAEIHVMNADSSNDAAVLSPSQRGEWYDMPAWYGGSTSLFYAHDVSQFDAGGQWLGDKMSVDGLNLTNGTRSMLVNSAQAPSTARSGALAWVAFTPGTLNFQLVVTSPDGSTTKPLVTDKDFMQVWRPRFSPDGQWIAFSGSGRKDPNSGSFLNLGALVPRAEAHGLPWDPYVIKVDGTGLRRLAAIGSDEQAMTWSPDGQTVALAYSDGIFDVPAGGGGLAKVV